MAWPCRVGRSMLRPPVREWRHISHYDMLTVCRRKSQWRSTAPWRNCATAFANSSAKGTRWRARRASSRSSICSCWRFSAVELIDRLEAHGYVRRSRSRDDRRSVLVALLPRGEKLLEQVAGDRIGELRASGAALVNAISALLENGGSPGAKRKRR
jgi:hypothetical protein